MLTKEQALQKLQDLQQLFKKSYSEVTEDAYPVKIFIDGNYLKVEAEFWSDNSGSLFTFIHNLPDNSVFGDYDLLQNITLRRTDHSYIKCPESGNRWKVVSDIDTWMWDIEPFDRKDSKKEIVLI